MHPFLFFIFGVSPVYCGLTAGQEVRILGISFLEVTYH
ncbi:MAG: hypothetical protein ACI9HJ_001737 [Ulvibacter sp.]|jgi:hypothetical protein